MDIQNPTQPVYTHQPPQEPKRNYWKIVLFFIAGVFIAGSLIFGGYYLGQQKQSSSQTATLSVTPSPKNPLLSPTTTPTTTSQDSGIPLTPNTVSFTRASGNLYFQYKGKIYTSGDTSFPLGNTQAGVPNLTNATWYGLINTPANATGFDEVFDFSQIPNSSRFIFTMRWDIPLANNNLRQDITVYLYDPTKQSNKVETLLTLSADGVGYKYPHGMEISVDGNYVAFDMYPCWNCGGSHPETMVMKISTKITKNIGKTSFFAWKTNGAYEYKDYIPMSCPTPTGAPGEYFIGECAQDPATLPLKTGQI